MERIALQKLIDWNNNKRKKPLIVWGARQVGKTYLVEELFAKKYYKNNYIYVDCKKEDEIREFCSKTANAEKIIEYISLRKGKQINEKTLLIFDEVQECPNIISSLKYFCLVCFHIKAVSMPPRLCPAKEIIPYREYSLKTLSLMN